MRPDIGRHAGAARLDSKADRFKYAFDELRAFEFLHAKLAEIIDRIADGGDLFGIAFDHFVS